MTAESERTFFYPRPACEACGSTTEPGTLEERDGEAYGHCERCGFVGVRWEEGR